MAKRGKKRSAPLGIRITQDRLVQGWSGPGGTRVRLARAGEADAVLELVKVVAEPEPAVLSAIDAGTAGTGLVTGLRGGFREMTLSLAEAAARDEMQRAAASVTLPLVAEGRDGTLVGALLEVPSGVLYDKVWQASAADERKRGGQALLSMMAVAKIKALAVAESARGQGVGGVLLKRAVQLYHQLGFALVYGQFDAASTLGDFYTRHGFDVLPEGAGTDIGYVLTGTSILLGAGPGERMFQLWTR